MTSTSDWIRSCIYRIAQVRDTVAAKPYQAEINSLRFDLDELLHAITRKRAPELMVLEQIEMMRAEMAIITEIEARCYQE